MTVEVAPRRTRKQKPASETLAIGEMGQTVFACPACARPLVNGARHCPGCGTRLILGVQAKRASALMSVGLLAGLVLGGGVAVMASAMKQAAHDAAAATSSGRPSAPTSPAPSTGSAAASTGTGTISSVPALSRSALVQAVAVDERLATSSAALAAAISASKFDTYGVAQILRATSADAILGLSLSSHIGAWSGGKELSGELTAFYTSIQETAAGGLSASIRNAKAYRAAGNQMLQVLGGLAALDGRVREVAGSAGITFVSTVVPAP